MTQNLEKLLDDMPKTILEIEGVSYEIPMGQPLLRGLQYLQLKGLDIEVTRGPFCWNGECRNCVCDFETDHRVKKEQRVCRYRVKGPVEMLKLNENYMFRSLHSGGSDSDPATREDR